MAEKKRVAFWRGTRESYEVIKKANKLDYWTRYSVKDVDTVASRPGKTVYTWTEYYGDNEIVETPGEVLPVTDIVSTLPEIMNPGDRYILVPGGEWSLNHIHFSVPDKKSVALYGCRISNELTGETEIVQLTSYTISQSFRIKGTMKAYVYTYGEFRTYDDNDAGDF